MTVNKIRLTEHFSLHEFECPCCGAVKLHPQLVIKLQILRETWGKPLVVNSGYRCEAHNAAVGGVPNSKHRHGLAADIRVPGNEQEDFRMLAKICGFSKVLLYKERNFVHVEVEGAAASAPAIVQASAKLVVVRGVGERGDSGAGKIKRVYLVTRIVRAMAAPAGPRPAKRRIVCIAQFFECPQCPRLYRRVSHEIRAYEKHPVLPLFTNGVPARGRIFLSFFCRKNNGPSCKARPVMDVIP